METHAPEDVMMKYLLGELSAAEQQAFEEQFFEDEEIFARLLAVENDLVDSYVQGELKGEERLRFIKNFLATSEGRQKLENAQALRHYIALKETVKPVEARATTKHTVWQYLLDFLRPQTPAFQYALSAAVLVLTVGLVWFIYQSNSLRNQLQIARNDQPRFLQLQRELQDAQVRERELQRRLAEQSGQNEQLAEQLRLESERIEGMVRELDDLRQRPSSILTAFLEPGLGIRGGTGPNNIVIPPGTQTVKLQLPLPEGKANYKSYNATLSEVGGGQILTHKNLKPEATRSGKALVVRLSPRMLQEKGYVFSVQAQTSDGRTESVEEYQFHVVKR
ncbi:MAG: hypothetical protein ACREBG_17015 [Pyrinomonadaceae bacterium]